MLNSNCHQIINWSHSHANPVCRGTLTLFSLGAMAFEKCDFLIIIEKKELCFKNCLCVHVFACMCMCVIALYMINIWVWMYVYHCWCTCAFPYMWKSEDKLRSTYSPSTFVSDRVSYLVLHPPGYQTHKLLRILLSMFISSIRRPWSQVHATIPAQLYVWFELQSYVLIRAHQELYVMSIYQDPHVNLHNKNSICFRWCPGWRSLPHEV